MKNDPEILYRWREQINYLLVDEYQDTNTAQYELVKMLVGARGNLTVVGDDDQSIYAWRGAEAENLSQLSDDFHDLHVIKLEQNYRSMGGYSKQPTRSSIIILIPLKKPYGVTWATVIRFRFWKQKMSSMKLRKWWLQ